MNFNVTEEKKDKFVYFQSVLRYFLDLYKYNIQSEISTHIVKIIL